MGSKPARSASVTVTGIAVAPRGPVVMTCCWPWARLKAAGAAPAPVAVKAKLPGVAAGRVCFTIVSVPTTSMGTSIPSLALHLDGEPASTQAAGGASQVPLAFCSQVMVAGSFRLPFWSGTHRTLTTPRSTVAGVGLALMSPQALPFRLARGAGPVGTPKTAQSALPPLGTVSSGGLPSFAMKTPRS